MLVSTEKKQQKFPSLVLEWHYTQTRIKVRDYVAPPSKQINKHHETNIIQIFTLQTILPLTELIKQYKGSPSDSIKFHQDYSKSYITSMLGMIYHMFWNFGLTLDIFAFIKFLVYP